MSAAIWDELMSYLEWLYTHRNNNTETKEPQK